MSKKGLLVVSFGSTYADTRKKCIEPLEREMAQNFEDYNFYRAFTSPTVRKIIKERDKMHVPSIEEALEQMCVDGITYCVIQPTHLIWGYETEYIHLVANQFSAHIPEIHIGNPLLGEEEDFKALIDILSKECESSKITLFVGHGTSHQSHQVYYKLWKKFRQFGWDNVYVGTVEGNMDTDYVLKHLKVSGYHEVVLHPLLFVAGEHVKKDIAGPSSDSWKSILEKNGFQVSCVLKGLGEYESIRSIYIKHALKVQQQLL